MMNSPQVQSEREKGVISLYGVLLSSNLLTDDAKKQVTTAFNYHYYGVTSDVKSA